MDVPPRQMLRDGSPSANRGKAGRGGGPRGPTRFGWSCLHEASRRPPPRDEAGVPHAMLGMHHPRTHHRRDMAPCSGVHQEMRVRHRGPRSTDALSSLWKAAVPQQTWMWWAPGSNFSAPSTTTPSVHSQSVSVQLVRRTHTLDPLMAQATQGDLVSLESTRSFRTGLQPRLRVLFLTHHTWCPLCGQVF